MEIKSKIQIGIELDLAITFEDLTEEQWNEYSEENKKEIILNNVKSNSEIIISEIINQKAISIDGTQI